MKQVRMWKTLRSSKRLDAEGVVCKIIKQSLSVRDVSAGWGDQVCVIKYEYKSKRCRASASLPNRISTQAVVLVCVCVCFPFCS